MRLEFLFCLVLLTLWSCVTDDNVTPAIPFKNIVGNFEGVSKVCTAPIMAVDTSCNFGVSNGFKVIIENLTTIKVTDATSQFVGHELNYIKTENLSGDQFHFFKGTDSNAILNLNFSENTRELKFESLVNTDGVLKSDYFIGIRK
jgi:hypothetical protein